MRNPKPNQIYRHFKGNLYKIITIATHTETGEKMIVYQALYGDFGDFVRPLDMFLEEVDSVKYPNAGQRYRFELVAKAAKEGWEEENREEQGREEMEEGINDDASDIDPMLEAYLDAAGCKERLEILEGMKGRITDTMITTMAVVMDFELPEGPLEDRLQALKSCLLMRQKYECTRLRD